ncbi:FliM/FliN family flagellar motor switch protein [Pleionea sp. CnH1-48]|uniref:FliM/FliN family flagellar motor switch protein n=1 Tax=Pleionea sp. CnH1-48 TaxID=2954494 RepID=UPI0020984FB6|nr:FliM/FliN family flagellar motor switch protein [Pleionea sp. CnH1-48]MCO7223705.1 FliM/FliN family flagellar motor switch protein [Pleionea sp. CnH1-48]
MSQLYAPVLCLSSRRQKNILKAVHTDVLSWMETWFCRGHQLSVKLSEVGQARKATSERCLMTSDSEVILDFCSYDRWFVHGVLGIDAVDQVDDSMTLIAKLQETLLASLYCETKRSQQFAKEVTFGSRASQHDNFYHQAIEVCFYNSHREVGHIVLMAGFLKKYLPKFESSESTMKLPDMKSGFVDETVPLIANLGSLSLSALEFSQLKSGDILGTNKELSDLFEVTSRGSQVFSGFLAKNKSHKVIVIHE